jgi:hypothetical protein
MPSTTIIAQPSQLMPAYNPVKYIIDNTNKNEPASDISLLSILLM